MLDQVVQVPDHFFEGGVRVAPAVRPQEGGGEVQPTMPRLSRIAASCLSVRLREWGQMAWTFECVATSGASESLWTSQKPFSLRCERSIMMRSSLQALDQGAAVVGQARARVRARRKRNGTPWPKMFERLQTGPIERSPALVEHVEHAQVRVDRLRALDVEDRGEHARIDAAADLGRRAADLHLPLRCPFDPQQQGGHVQVTCWPSVERQQGRQGHVVLRPRHQLVDADAAVVGGHEDREETAREAAGAHARPVQVADVVALQEGALRRRRRCAA